LINRAAHAPGGIFDPSGNQFHQPAPHGLPNSFHSFRNFPEANRIAQAIDPFHPLVDLTIGPPAHLADVIADAHHVCHML
jgi:hypothetical protein